MAEQQGFHNKYRPKTFDEVIGNEAAITKLRGIIAKGKFPSGILFTGPAGVGKTTLARCFVNEVNGPDTFNVNCSEINFGENRAIDDIRQLIQVAKLRPAQGAKRRFILGDEAQQLLGNAPAANAFLKPLEEPVSTTTFLLCSMEPDKFAGTSTGRAIASRCLNLSLKAPSEEELYKQARRIAKGEGMTEYMTKELLQKVAGSSNSSMRVLANNMEALNAFYHGLSKKRDLTEEDIEEALNLNASNDDVIAARMLTAVYARKYVAAHKEVLDVNDAFGFINKCLWLNWFCLNNVILKGARHPKVWGNQHSWALLKQMTERFNEDGLNRDQQITVLGEVQTALTSLKMGAGAFAVDEKMAIAGMLWTVIQTLKAQIK